MNKVIRLRKAISQLRKTTMKSTMPSLSEEDQDGSLPRHTEITLPNNSKKKKLKKLPRPPLKKVERVKKEKVEKLKKAVKLKKRRKRKKNP